MEQQQSKYQTKKQTPLSMGFRKVASYYLDDAKLRFAEKTYKYKASVYRAFLEFNGDQEITEISIFDIDQYLKTRPTNHNFNVHRKELSALFSFAIARFEIEMRNPALAIPKLPHATTKKTIPLGETVEKILMVSDPKVCRPFLLVLLHLAARVDEVLRLKWEDIDFQKREVTRWTKKRSGGNYEPIIAYMNDELKEQLEIASANRNSETWVFANPHTGTRYKDRRKMLYRLCEEAGVPRVRFHELRHYVASILANNPKISKKTIQDILGHKSLTTTEIYLHSVGDSQEIALKSLDGIFIKRK